MADTYFRFVSFEFTTSLGPPPGRYPVLALDPRFGSAHDALLVKLIGAPAAQPFLLRRAKPVEPDTPIREVNLLQVTWAQTSMPVAAAGEADRLFAELRKEAAREELVAHAVAVLNTAIRAAAVSAGDPYCHEVSRLDPREVTVGLGTGEEIDAATFTTAALRCPPPPRGKAKLAERLRPSEAVLAALTGRSTVLDGELHLLRALLDLDQDRDGSALLELEAAVERLLADVPRFDPDLVAQHLSAKLQRAESVLPTHEPGASPPAAADLLEIVLELIGAVGALRAAATATPA